MNLNWIGRFVRTVIPPPINKTPAEIFLDTHSKRIEEREEYSRRALDEAVQRAAHKEYLKQRVMLRIRSLK